MEYTTKMPRTRAAYPDLPGDTRVRLLDGAVTSEGKTLPAGTIALPLRGGFDGAVGREYQRMRALGEEHMLYDHYRYGRLDPQVVV